MRPDLRLTCWWGQERRECGFGGGRGEMLVTHLSQRNESLMVKYQLVRGDIFEWRPFH